MASFPSVHTLDDLDTLDEREMSDGFHSFERGDPEPGANRGRAFWHGWCARAMDAGLLPITEGHRKLVRAWSAREREGGRRMPDVLYRWAWRARLPTRHGELFRVLCRGKLNSCLIRFERDGWLCVTSRNALRRVRDV